jgi:hypothetical protein
MAVVGQGNPQWCGPPWYGHHGHQRSACCNNHRGTSMEKTFEFELNQEVSLRCSGEQGSVIGRAEYTECEPSYFVRYKAADGRAVQAWWSGSALQAA